MSEPDPLFPGFETGRVPTADGAAEIHYRIAGAGPPLLLLHGFPQTGAMWARVAAALRDRFRVVVPDLRGYGRSRGPVGAERYAKREMARDFTELMTHLGAERFQLAGHDRGGRVAYRLALDAPERVEKLAVLDILPTAEYWRGFGERAFAVNIYHWAFLARPYPFPETLIGASPEFYIDETIASWAADGLTAFDPSALEIYRDNARDPARLRAMCDDYRAGATIDVEHDEADMAAGRRIKAPVLALWGGRGIAEKASSPLPVWERWAENVSGAPIDCGHFLPEEQPDATAEALATFFSSAA